MPKRTHAYHLAATRARQVSRERQAEFERRQLRQRRLRRLVPAVVVIVAAFAVFGIVELLTGGSSNAWPVSTTTAVTAAPSIVPAGTTTSAACANAQAANVRKADVGHAPAPSINVAHRYTAIIVTDVGAVVVDLDAKQAPYNVNNFIYLAVHHYYDCQPFSLAGTGYLVQAGSVAPAQGPLYKVRLEHLPRAGAKYALSSVVLLGSASGSSGGGLAVVVGSAGQGIAHRDPVIGTVASGVAVLDAIAAGGGTAADGYAPNKHHWIKSVTINELV